ncbi:hypothetical protein [Paractinoplanes brasiliensis]|nr:hypothetical protein [Actinoplanes brasiliensis]
MMTNNVDALAGEARLARALSIITRSGGDLILLTRDIVRGIIADLFAQTVIWTAGSAEGLHRLPVTARLGLVVATVWRIQFYLDALADGMSELACFIDG